MKNIINFLILITFHCEIRGLLSGITEQRKFTPKLQTVYNLVETTAQNSITSDDILAGEKFDDNELKKLFVKKFKLYKNINGEIRNNANQAAVQRKSRDVDANIDISSMKCLSCTGKGTRIADENCYNGVGTNIDTCAYTENCYTELHPQYIKRGCMLPGTLNRTFVCKCPLCNDKPSYDSTYYEYTRISDWEYDNERLQKPIIGMDLICKVCETTGTSKVSDNACKYGQNADYMVCAKHQLCYTTFVEQSNYVSRGCISKPFYNSMIFYCNESLCNKNQFFNPLRKKPLFELYYAEPRSKLVSSTAFNIYNYSPIDSILVFVWITTHLFQE
ncbi:hypothetical protein K1T71_001334 [Dendrolimus kikuchii]|uniref:Uncharacterized protein n=1 Tax=Dendrolimus kikuchii TaxID=765133 RepID=A0ACC1DI79_9NEOP|nr:hypothetical protein K1T71_001334 [Dendrolimus kikuchii]